MKRILSGIRPTGNLHLGNYLGSIKQWVNLSQEPDSECFFMVADYHALAPEKKLDLSENALDLLAWELAAGLNPDNVTLFVQSAVSAHNDLTRILSTLVTVSELQRMTQYKDLLAQGTEVPSVALLNYPILMAADILLYKATIVPVGDDQVQHIEMARTLARRLNKHAPHDIVPIPQARLTSAARVMSLNDPAKKMSKSLPQGALALEEDEATLRQKISRAVTDTGPATSSFPDELMTHEPFSPEQRALLFEHMTPGVRNLFILLEETTTDQHSVDTFLHNFRNQTLKYSELKAAVADAVVGFILPLQQRYHAIRSNEAALTEILQAGTLKAAAVADATLKEVKDTFRLLDLSQ